MNPSEFDLLVIGGGPAGYVAAICAAQKGLKVGCIEIRDSLGGTCLNVGCIPSKALLHSSFLYTQAAKDFAANGIVIESLKFDLETMMKRKEGVVSGLSSGIDFLFKKNGVTRILGEGHLLDANTVEVKGQLYKTKNIILATGSAPVELPFLPFDEKRVLSSTGALSLLEVPEHLIVIGGGAIGLELGSVYLRLGAKVTVIESLPEILSTTDPEIAKHAKRALKKQGMNFQMETKVLCAKIEEKGVHLTAINKQSKEISLLGDRVLVAVGRRPFTQNLGLETLNIATQKGRVLINQNFQTSVPNIYAIGDIVEGPMLAHKAEEEAVACVNILTGSQDHAGKKAIPSVVYIHPEVAAVGLSTTQCQAQGLATKESAFSFKANSRARCTGENEGLVKIIAHAKTDKILGVHILGSHASELIAEATLAIQMEICAKDFALSCHAHPTLSEALYEAALGLNGKAIHA